MKRKIIFAALAVAMLFTVFALSASALDLDAPFEDYQYMKPTRDSVSTMIEVFELQRSLGIIPSNLELIAVYYENPWTVLVATDSLDTLSIVTSSGQGHSYKHSNSSFRFFSYVWTSRGWQPSLSKAYSSTGVTVPMSMHFYSSLQTYYVGGGFSAFIGLTSNSVFGSYMCDANSIKNHFQTMYDYVSNYETDIDNALLTGQSYGFQLGVSHCETTHQQIIDESYDEGYDFGYSSGHSVGLYDCDKTHQALKDEAFADGRAQGAMQGYADCQSTHPALIEEAKNEGYAAGDADGYMRGLYEGEKNSQLELDTEYWRGRSEGYDLGYTEAINTSESVIDFVDAIFSAPINGLYHAFNIEIFGINLFNVFMLFISIIIVGGVVLLVLKFR